METLLKQLRELPSRLKALPAATRWILLAGVGVLLAASVAAALVLGAGDDYQYAFTNLGADDGAEAAAQLTAAGIPYRLEAGGNALAVPADKVYEARLLLASAGLPKAGGVGFELFDRGDIGVSEFTQRVNLRRAIEGELARTIGSLAEVRSARVHVTLAEKGLYRDEDRPASASVVLNLRPGRSLGDRELAGVRHLVASAVPGLASGGVSIVDGSGTVLSAEDDWGSTLGTQQRQIEADLERRIVSILEPAVGSGAVVARVTASIDASEVSTSKEVFDPDGAVVKNERKVSQAQQRGATAARGVAGAAGNQPGAGAGAGNSTTGQSNVEDETRAFEVSRTVTKSVSRAPRIERISVAILLDGVDGKPRADDEVARLGALAQRAVGLDPKRGDQLEITSVNFARSGDEAAPEEAKPDGQAIPRDLLVYGAAGLGGLAVLGLGAWAVLRLRRKRVARQPSSSTLELLREDANAELGAASTGIQQALPDPAIAVRERARELASVDPVRAAHLLRAWIQADLEQQQEAQR